MALSSIGLTFEDGLKEKFKNKDDFNLLKIAISEDKHFYQLIEDSEESDFDVAIEKMIAQDQPNYRHKKFLLKTLQMFWLRHVQHSMFYYTLYSRLFTSFSNTPRKNGF